VNNIKKIFPLLAAICLIITLVLLIMGKGQQAGPYLSAFFVLLSVSFRMHASTRGFAYTILIFAAVTISMYYPSYFHTVGDFSLKTLIVPLLQLIMFGMGTSMSFNDFAGVVKMPKSVLVGMLCQYTIMPILGFTLATSLGFSGEIAAGIVLIGSSPGGLASNVMAYLAKANLALSVTLTAISTLVSPIMTPFLMKILAGEFVPINFWAMMLSIVKMVILPIIAGLIFNRIFHGKAKWLDKAMPIVSMGGIAFIITIITAAGRDSLLNIGLLLVLAAIIHNAAGYFLGYWSGRLFRMDEQSCRTIALEVGMQNGGLASGIALEMGKVATIGLAPAVFGPWMNISGSSLATYWRDKPIADSGESEKKKKND